MKAIAVAIAGLFGCTVFAASTGVSPTFSLHLKKAASGINPTIWQTKEVVVLSPTFSLRTKDVRIDEDGDGLPDIWEAHYGLDTSSSNATTDSDGDGFTDLEEYNAGTNPIVKDDFSKSILETLSFEVDTGAYPLGFSIDTDNDGMPDWWEVAYGLNRLVNDSDEDLDGDTISNLAEYQLGSLPNRDDRLEEMWALSLAFFVDTIGRAADTDKDGMPDWWEEKVGLNPLVSNIGLDSDGDGWLDIEEYNAGRHPLIADDWTKSSLETDKPFTTDTRVIYIGGNPSFDTAFAVYAISGAFICDTGGLYYDWDGDGIPNWWEARFATSKTGMSANEDSDGDGYSNHDEFVIYSDPTDKASSFNLELNQVQTPQPMLMSLSTTTTNNSTQLELSWMSVKGRTYTVLTTEQLTTGWNDTPYAVLEGTGERLSVILPQGKTAQFFKVSITLTPIDSE